MKKTKSQSALEFCDKFDGILKELDTCNPEAPISEDEVKSILYHAVKDTSPMLVSTRINSRGRKLQWRDEKNKSM